jgi:enamine deaminase RidA (YjgF/YER057c/UK114 family)
VPRESLNPAGLSEPTGYTHVIVVSPGKLVYISGQVSLNANSEVVGEGDLRAQATQVYANLKTALAAVGASFNEVVKLNTYVVNLQPEHAAILREVRQTQIPQAPPPASTLVGVTGLARKEFMIEVEAVAVVK